jgi:hypothetical protein
MIIKKLLDRKFAFRKGSVYYLYIEDKPVLIGRSKKECEAKLKTFDSDKLSLILENSRLHAQSNHAVPDKSREPKKEIDLTKQEKKETRNYSNLLESELPQQGKIAELPKIPNDAVLKILSSIEVNESRGDNKDAMKITIGGIDHLREDHPVIKNCPVVFAFPRRADMIINKDEMTSYGWPILDKVLHKPLIDLYQIKWYSDHSAKESYVSYKELVVGFKTKVTYMKDRAELRAKGNLGGLNVLNARNEQAERIGTQSDPDLLTKKLDEVTSTDRNTVTQQMQETGKSRTEAIDMINSFDNTSKKEGSVVPNF